MAIALTAMRAAAWLRLVAATMAVAIVTAIYVNWLPGAGPTTVSTTFLLIVLVVAASSPLWVAVVASVVAMLAFNYFFLPPLYTLTVTDPENWVALMAFLTVSLIASNLSAGVRARTNEAIARRDELARLFDLSRDVLVMNESRDALPAMARAMARRFQLAFVAIALPRASGWESFSAGALALALDEGSLSAAFSAAQTAVEFDARTRAYGGHRAIEVSGQTVQLVPLRAGTKAIGLLATAGRDVEPGTRDALAGIAAIAIERADLLEERKAADLTRQSEQLKTTLLASIGHDLRTPLTAIRIAASNIRDASLTADQRADQSDLILSEAERLTQLFENILEMARIDAGALAADARWAHVSEIVDGARAQVARLLTRHTVHVQADADALVRLDPRLAANALARVLENAAQYAPEGSVITLTAAATDVGVRFSVRDHGPGIPAADLPHVFERFYRGQAASGRPSGTGMGLWIARELLAAQGGRIWAENAVGGGALFTASIPASTRAATHADEDTEAT